MSPDGSEDETHKVTFLPTINNPATEMCTIKEMLNQIQQRSEILKIDEVDLVLDHAIYAKTLEILVHNYGMRVLKYVYEALQRIKLMPLKTG